MSSHDSSNDEQYNVEKIIQCKKVRNKLYYLVKWDGYTSDDNSWEPIENLANCDQLMREFNQGKSNQREKSTTKKTKKNQTKKESINKSTKSRKSIVPVKNKRKGSDSISHQKENGITNAKKISSELTPSSSGSLNLCDSETDYQAFVSAASDLKDESSDSSRSLHVTNCMDSSGKQIFAGNQYTRDQLLSMFPGDLGGFKHNYTATCIKGATIRNNVYYLLVQFEELDTPQFIKNSIVRRHVPQIIINFYEDKVSFLK